ncbi:hypothetical protein CSHISOI_03947 [Colletotrichum shisoi]|uniref:Uncharacterized protein n=1 Tax=Colletotrichum shisoi TaxID=2078593 RepID=A0A5Q4BWH2_9PEZI|nr:hypothetical protein CSHISOI_03947 [Colletotrichum shisoi]
MKQSRGIQAQTALESPGLLVLARNDDGHRGLGGEAGGGAPAGSGVELDDVLPS